MIFFGYHYFWYWYYFVYSFWLYFKNDYKNVKYFIFEVFKTNLVAVKNRNKIRRSRIFRLNWFLTLQNLRLLEFMTKYFVLSFCALWSTLLTSVTNHLTKMFGNWETEWTWKGVHLKSLHPNNDDFLQKLGTGGAMNCLSWKNLVILFQNSEPFF